MKCPYRICKVTGTVENVTDADGYILPSATSEREYFEECHLTECPLFCVVAGKQTCRKAEKEAQ